MYKLGKTFKRGGKVVRWAYKGGKRNSKILVRKVLTKKNMKKSAKTILILGVWYWVDQPLETEYGFNMKRRARTRGMRLPFLGD